MRRGLAWALGTAFVLTGAAAAAPSQKLGDYQPTRQPEAVYETVCGYCHGRNVGPILLGRKLPADMVKLIAREGRNGMPAFRPTEITNEELDALAKWISTSAPNKGDHGG